MSNFDSDFEQVLKKLKENIKDETTYIFTSFAYYAIDCSRQDE